MPADILDWHRLFGIALTDLFSDTPWRVELERDVGLESQFLDVVIVARGEGAAGAAGGAAEPELPDGLEGLRAHNLLTFKSRREPMDGWALDELIGHYVNYRKQLRQGDHLPDESGFGLYAVSVRMPTELSSAGQLRPAGRSGVFDIPWRTRHIRLVVLGEIEPHPRNAVWELLHTRVERIRHGVRHYRFRNPGARSLLFQLYLTHVLEDAAMPYTLDDFIRDTAEKIAHAPDPRLRQFLLDQIPPEERLRGLDPEDRLRGLDPEDRLRGLDPDTVLKRFDPEERLRGLDPEERLRGLDPEDRLRGLSAEELRALKAHLDTLN